MFKHPKKITLALISGLVFVTIFFSGIIVERTASPAQASFLDMIRALVTINPLRVDVIVPAAVEEGKTFRVEATLSNQGEIKIENAQAEIFLPAGIALLKKNQVQKVKVIPAKKSKKAVWSVRGEELGNFGISVVATGEVNGDFISAQSNTVIVTVQAKISPPGSSSNLLQRFFDFFQNLFNN